LRVESGEWRVERERVRAQGDTSTRTTGNLMAR
jgi:hypothetical protein